MGELILLRHGQTNWSATGKHTGRTDIPLTSAGEAHATRLSRMLASRVAAGHPIAAVITSPAARAKRTAELAGLGGPDGPGVVSGLKPEIDADLWEWDYGGYEGLTTPEIQAGRDGWYLWQDGVIPGDAAHPGENVGQVGARADRVLARAAAQLPDGDVVLVGHGHALRVLVARYLGLMPAGGRLFRLDTGTLSTLGTEHGQPTMLTWNVPPPA
jgi:probable phosphoglycerate mutase